LRTGHDLDFRGVRRDGAVGNVGTALAR